MAEFMTKPKANEKQYGGSHYQKQAIQAWDFITQNKLGYLEGTSIKYISRWKDKGGLEDIRKAIHFLEKLLETETQNETKASQLSAPCQLGGISGAGCNSLRGVATSGLNSASSHVASQSSSAARHAPVNVLESPPLDPDAGISYYRLSSMDGFTYPVGGFRNSGDVAGQAWDTIPVYPGELNDIAVIRADAFCGEQKYV